MNIQVQLCGLIVIVLLYAFYRTQKTLKLYRERLFALVMRCALATLSFDVLSIVGIHYRSVLPQIVVHFLCKAYLISILSSSFSALFYMLPDIMEEQKRKKLFRRVFVLLGLEFLSIILSPIDVYEQGREVYSLGIAVVLTYAYTISFIVTTLVLAAVKLWKANRRRAVAVILWMSFWVVSAAIQFLHNELLLVGFAGAMGMVILYVMLEAPETNLDKQFNCFNSYAFDVFCSEMHHFGQKFSLLEINLVNKDLTKSLEFHPIQTPMRIISLISQEKDVRVFKNVDYSLYVVSEDVQKLKTVYDKCAAYIAPYGIENCLSFQLLENNQVFSNSVELADLLSYSRHLTAERTGELVTVTDQIVAGFVQEEQIANEIKDALQEDRIEVFYQPIYSFETSDFETAEALVRMRGRDGKLVSPGMFIPVAEKRGLIVELGERIFEKVCAFISRENPAVYGVHYLEVNLSVVQCERKELADQLTHIMKRFEISPENVNFEITETGSIKTKIPLLENMCKLKEEGATFSLDDFGKGESNLIYLIDMPVSILKMDYDLTKSYHVNEKAKSVVRSVVELAHSLGLKVVAEGVETEEELTAIRATGVDFIQGFYFSRPMPQEEYLEFIRTHNGGGDESQSGIEATA